MNSNSPGRNAEITLFKNAARFMFAAIRDTTDGAEVLEALEQVHIEMDRTFAGSLSSDKAKVACRAGCSFCCYVAMGVQAHEVILVAIHIRETFTEDEIADAIAKTGAHRVLLGQSRMANVPLPRSVCALLKDNRCSVYEARPEVCRAHHSASVSACETSFRQNSELAGYAYIGGLRSRMFMSMLAVDSAIVEAGYDPQPYDFGAALNEVLLRPECTDRWLQKLRPTFPDSCKELSGTGAESPPMAGMSQMFARLSGDP